MSTPNLSFTKELAAQSYYEALITSDIFVKTEGAKALPVIDLIMHSADNANKSGSKYCSRFILSLPYLMKASPDHLLMQIIDAAKGELSERHNQKHCGFKIFQPAEACGLCLACIDKAKDVVLQNKTKPLNELPADQQREISLATIVLTKSLGRKGFQNFIKRGDNAKT